MYGMLRWKDVEALITEGYSTDAGTACSEWSMMCDMICCELL